MSTEIYEGKLYVTRHTGPASEGTDRARWKVTIRAGILAPDGASDGEVVLEAIAALDALVVENQRQADRIKWLEGEEAGWRTGTLVQTERLGKATAENQQLRDAITEAMRHVRTGTRGRAYAILSDAMAGTPSEHTE